jgi:hypothetical protein
MLLGPGGLDFDPLGDFRHGPGVDGNDLLGQVWILLPKRRCKQVRERAIHQNLADRAIRDEAIFRAPRGGFILRQTAHWVPTDEEALWLAEHLVLLCGHKQVVVILRHRDTAVGRGWPVEEELPRIPSAVHIL